MSETPAFQSLLPSKDSLRNTSNFQERVANSTPRLVLALKVPCPMNSLSPRQTEVAGHHGPGFFSHDLIKGIVVSKLPSLIRRLTSGKSVFSVKI